MLKIKGTMLKTIDKFPIEKVQKCFDKKNNHSTFNSQP